MGKKILIVEDEQDIRESLREVLEDEGFEVKTAVNGKDALAKLESNECVPDLILLDLLMPVMNGLEFRKEQMTRKTHSGIPVVIMSADTATEQKASRANAKFLKKPLELDRLFAAIKETIL